MNGFRLAVDYGSSNTVAVLGWPDGRVRPLMFGGSPVLSSAVHVEPGGRILVGDDAHRAARLEPARFEANPKRRLDQDTLLLGDVEVHVVNLIAATLRVVAAEAVRIAGVMPARVTLTYPAAWAGPRQARLLAAAWAARLGEVTLVSEPVAAATYFAAHSGARGDVVVYDLGGGTCDVSIVRVSPSGLDVLDSGGLDDLGGLDLDQVVLDQIGAAVAPIAPEPWARVTAPVTPADRRAAMLLRDDVRSAKEALSRHPSASVFIPQIDRDVPVTREAFEQAAAARLSPSADLTVAMMARAGLGPGRVAGLFLVGGSTRVPVVATLLHRRTGIAPTVQEQPELVVAEGALATIAPAVPAVPPVVSAPPVVSGPPVSSAPVSVAPVSAAPLSPAPVSAASVSAAPVSAAPLSPAASALPAPAFAPPTLQAPVGPHLYAPQQVPAGSAARRRGLWAAIAAAGLVAIVAVAFMLQTVLGDRERTSGDPPTTSASSSTGEGGSTPTTSPGGSTPVLIFAELPDPCGLAGDLPTRYQFHDPDPFYERERRQCQWSFVTKTAGGGLRINLELMKKSVLDASFESRKQLSPSSGEDGPDPLPGLGDDAYLVRQDMADEQRGTRVVVRYHNVLIDVKWYGYTPPGADNTQFSYSQLKADVVAVVKIILAALK